MNDELLVLTTDIVAAHVSNNHVATDELPGLIASVHAALAGATQPVASEVVKGEPAVPVRSSIKTDYLISLESGKKVKMLKRYLMTNYGMTPDDYRAKWGLPKDYPMVAPAYAEARRTLAKSFGLGRKKAVEAVEAVETAVEAVVDVAKTTVVDVAKATGKTLGAAAAKAAAVAHLTGDVAAPAPKPRGRPPKAVAKSAVPAPAVPAAAPAKRTGWWAKKD